MKLAVYCLTIGLGISLLSWGSSAQLFAAQGCDPSYPTVCLASPPPDLDCGEIEARNFTVVGVDPHRFDGDRDGIGCEE